MTPALDRAESLKVGEGKLDLGIRGNGTAIAGSLGAFADYEHRLNKRWSAFGTAEAGYGWGPVSNGWRADLVGGVRVRF